MLGKHMVEFPIFTSSSVENHRVGNQPIVLVTHRHGQKLAEMWKTLKWDDGKKIIICDCTNDILSKV